MIRLTIDPVACDAYGYCAELLPEAITLDEWGYPMVEGQPLPAELLAAARRAARDCPRRALTVHVQAVTESASGRSRLVVATEATPPAGSQSHQFHQPTHQEHDT